jgi:hypothetical protein
MGKMNGLKFNGFVENVIRKNILKQHEADSGGINGRSMVADIP